MNIDNNFNNPVNTKKISKEFIEELIRLEARQNTYMPSDDIAKQLKEKTLLLIVAPTCMGKTTVIQRVTEHDERFSTVGSFTTRDPRKDEGGKRFTYVEHTDEGLKKLFDRIEKKEVVQYMIHPTTKNVYGTDITDYPTEYNLLDYITTGIVGIRKLPFKSTPTISIIAEPSQWLYWFNQRFPSGHPERHHRRDEAILCFRWLLAQPIPSVNWIVNGPDMLDKAARQIIRVGLGEDKGDLLGRKYTEQGLIAAHTIK